jgi:hypothetical protein
MAEAAGVEAKDNCIVDAGRYATTLVNVTSSAKLSDGSQSIASWGKCPHGV